MVCNCLLLKNFEIPNHVIWIDFGIFCAFTSIFLQKRKSLSFLDSIYYVVLSLIGLYSRTGKNVSTKAVSVYVSQQSRRCVSKKKISKQIC